MGSVDEQLAADLRDELGLVRAVETGTYEGATARKLGNLFPSVVTVEQSDVFYARATEALRDAPHITVLQGHSAPRLAEVAEPTPTLYYLDAHWSGGLTSGEEDECPVLREIDALRAGHPDDCVIIDDARLFAAAPPPPHDPGQWPALPELFDALRSIRPGHFVTVLNDQVIAAPPRAKPRLDAYAWRVQDTAAAEPAAVDRFAAALWRLIRR
jgi:hypothetical protein